VATTGCSAPSVGMTTLIMMCVVLAYPLDAKSLSSCHRAQPVRCSFLRHSCITRHPVSRHRTIALDLVVVQIFWGRSSLKFLFCSHVVLCSLHEPCIPCPQAPAGNAPNPHYKGRRVRLPPEIEVAIDRQRRRGRARSPTPAAGSRPKQGLRSTTAGRALRSFHRSRRRLPPIRRARSLPQRLAGHRLRSLDQPLSRL
jgi:hypothetical protein